MVTLSWYAWLPLRTRVSMSAIGSVIVIRVFHSCRGFHGDLRPWVGWWLPGALRDARELAAVCHLAKADAAEAELLVDRPRPAAALAAGVTADRELGLAGGLDLESSLRHVSSPCRGIRAA